MPTAPRYLAILIILSLAGCAPSAPPAVPTITPTAATLPPSPTVLPTSDAAASQTAAPTKVLGTPLPRDMPVFKPQTIVLAADVRTPSWSPDGHWISFWTPVQDVTDPDYWFINVKPGFYEVAAGQTCYHDEFGGDMQMQYPTIYSYWQPDSRPVIVSNGGNVADNPCGDFTPIAYTDIPGWDYALSTDGRYRAETAYQHDPNVATTVISEAKTTQWVDTVMWEHSGGQVGGTGRWLDNQRLLLYGSDRGPLLYTVGGGLIEVLPELFGIAYTPEYSAGGVLDTTTGNYHLLLNSADEQTGMKLYHSETGQVEELPFKYAWSTGFSPDGHWLLLQRPLGDPAFDYNTEWIRPVDGADEDVALYAHVAGDTVWSGASGLLAAPQRLDSDTVLILTFPEGDVIQRWTVDDFRIYPLGWSPDGTKLLIMGHRKYGDPFYRDPQGVGLFLATIQP